MQNDVQPPVVVRPRKRDLAAIAGATALAVEALALAVEPVARAAAAVLRLFGLSS